MRKLSAVLAILVAAGTLAIHARELEEGTVTDDGSGPCWPPGSCPPPPPTELHFQPNQSNAYFKLTNMTGNEVVLHHVRARLAGPGAGSTFFTEEPMSGCGSGTEIVSGGPLRTIVVDGDFPEGDTGFSLGVTLQACESVLIEVLGATPAADHILRLTVEDTGGVGAFVGFLEAWDGECND